MYAKNTGLSTFVVPTSVAIVFAFVAVPPAVSEPAYKWVCVESDLPANSVFVAYVFVITLPSASCVAFVAEAALPVIEMPTSVVLIAFGTPLSK